MKKEQIKRYISFFLALNLLFEVVSPTLAVALTQGPYQPEYSSFEPAASSEMVDIFTGDFKYNIPLLDVDGYPVNIAYHAGVNMDEEASWVGLGWGLNVGSINRSVRGLPDDFNGETVNTETYMKKHASIGIGALITIDDGGSIGVTGASIGYGVGIGAGFLVKYDNYKGFGTDIQLDASLSLTVMAGVAGYGLQAGLTANMAAGGGISIDSQNGTSLTGYKSLGLSVGATYEGYGLSVSHNVGVGTTINTRTGTVYNTYSSSTGVGASISVFKPIKSTAYNPNSGKTENVTLGGSLGTAGVGVGHSQTVPASSVGYNLKSTNSYIGHGSSFTAKAGFYGCIYINFLLFSISKEAGAYFGLNGFYNEFKISDNVQALKSYGYLNLQNADNFSLMDFNRSNDGPLFMETPHLAMATHTYDLYSASAQGQYLNFRAHRSDAGVVHDYKTFISNSDHDFSGELGVGLFMHLLITSNQSHYSGSSGGWNTLLNGSMQYYKGSAADDNKETSYFKAMGELTASDEGYFAKVNNENLSMPVMTQISPGDVEALNPLAGASSASATNGAILRSKREIRNTDVNSLTAVQASQYGLQSTIPVYNATSFGLTSGSREVASTGNLSRKTVMLGTTSIDVSNQLSEISTMKDDGVKYVYGLPVYNLTKQEVAFNCSANPSGSPSAATISNTYGLVSYSSTGSSNDVSGANNRGVDNAFHRQTLPAYAQGYLLTSVLSPDYIDLTNNGPTYDDIGNYTRFNYSKGSQYNWRVPYGPTGNASNWAAYDKGLIADKYDDKGYYQYGTRDLWYLHSIETKNYVAFFHTSERKDAKGVYNPEGDISGGTRPSKLDKIELYAKDELIRASLDVATNPVPVPVKVISFEYDYSLCKNVFNNDGGTTLTSNETANQGGKLTLKKIYISYGSSNKGQLTPYVFDYADSNHDGTEDTGLNPNYDPKSVDRWGNYKANLNSSSVTGDNSGNANNDEFPYSEQNKGNADVYAAAWNLSTIHTPTGASVKVDYESDDYSYVQDEPVAQMLPIHDFISTLSGYDPTASGTGTQNVMHSKYLILDLSKLNIPISTSTSNITKYLKDNLLRNETYIYFKCLMLLNGVNSPGLNGFYYEYVPGYAMIDYGNIGVLTSSAGKYDYAYVGILEEGINDDGTGGGSVNPITKAGWQFMRTHIPRVAYPGTEPQNMGSGGPIQTIISIVIGLGNALADFVNGVTGHPNNRFYNHQWCHQIYYPKSWARVYTPNKSKLGGGYRVKKVTSSDEWNNMISSESTNVYGQTYDYTTTEKGSTISSGVAQYEPFMGGDEISLRKPIDYMIQKRMAPDDHLYQEEPLGEAFYPAPLVGYSKVTVKTVAQSGSCGIGKTEYNFYTAKDFPISVSSTGVSTMPVESDVMDDFSVVANYFKILNASEGYVLKMNDMHGKLKSQLVYGEGNATSAISGATYYYNQSGHNLSENVQTIDEHKVVRTETLGKSIETTTDLRQSTTTNNANSKNFLMDLDLCVGISINTTYSSGSQVIGANSAVITKIVQQYGILKKVETFTDKAKTTTENMMWDRNTGEAVLTKTVNNYDAPLYQMKYPAYWMYSGMSGTYARQGLKASMQNTTSSTTATYWNPATGILPSNVTTITKEGDEIFLTQQSSSGSFTFHGWVHQDPSDNLYKLMDALGHYVKNTNYTIPSDAFLVTIINPAEKNQQSFAAANETALDNPLTNSSPRILNAGAVEYCNNWNSFTAVPSVEATDKMGCFPNGTTNTYISGFSGHWRPWRSFAYKTTRAYDPSQPDTRTDGAYQQYVPFWNYTSGWNTIYAPMGDYNRWVTTAENKIFAPDGNLLESKDALGLNHSQLYCNNFQLLKAKASNAKYREIGFDSYEDYATTYPYMSGCMAAANYHFAMVNTGFSPTGSSLSRTKAHTGRYSLKIANNSSALFSAPTNYSNPYSTNDGRTTSNCSGGDGVKTVALLPDTRYLVSFWVNGDNNNLTDYASLFTFVLTIPSGALSGVSVQKTTVINGWQKYEYVFTTPTTGDPVTGTLNVPSASTAAQVYLDDFRLQPYNASMVCYVYDPFQLRLVATLDDRNYATIMEYDNEGMLVRSKKETEKRVYTINESRSSVKK